MADGRGPLRRFARAANRGRRGHRPPRPPRTFRNLHRRQPGRRGSSFARALLDRAHSTHALALAERGLRLELSPDGTQLILVHQATPVFRWTMTEPIADVRFRPDADGGELTLIGWLTHTSYRWAGGRLTEVEARVEARARCSNEPSAIFGRNPRPGAADLRARNFGGRRVARGHAERRRAQSTFGDGRRRAARTSDSARTPCDDKQRARARARSRCASRDARIPTTRTCSRSNCPAARRWSCRFPTILTTPRTGACCGRVIKFDGVPRGD